MTLYEDFLVGATSLKGLTGVEFVTDDPIVDPWAGFLAEGPYRYQPEIIDGMPGEVPDEDPVRDAFDFVIGPFAVKGDTRPAFLAAMAAVRAMFSAVNFTGTRRQSATAGPFYVDDSANCRYGGLLVVKSLGPLEAQVVLQIRNLDGEWS